MEMKFYYCKTCGNLAVMAVASGVIPVCCGAEMVSLTASTKEEGHEKHLPEIEISEPHRMKIRVGNTLHPSLPNHHIVFICLQTSTGYSMRYLGAEEPPEICIAFTGKPIAVYAYCNIHGLWRSDVSSSSGSCSTSCGKSTGCS